MKREVGVRWGVGAMGGMGVGGGGEWGVGAERCMMGSG